MIDLMRFVVAVVQLTLPVSIYLPCLDTTFSFYDIWYPLLVVTVNQLFLFFRVQVQFGLVVSRV